MKWKQMLDVNPVNYETTGGNRLEELRLKKPDFHIFLIVISIAARRQKHTANWLHKNSSSY